MENIHTIYREKESVGVFLKKSDFTEKQKKYVYFALITAGVYLFMKFISPLCSPFLAAFCISVLMHRLAGKLPFRMKKNILASFLLLVLIGVLFLILVGIGYSALECCYRFRESFAELEDECSMLLQSCCMYLEENLEIGDSIADFCRIKLFPGLLGKSLPWVKGAAGLISFLVVTMIAVFLILKDYELMSERIRRIDELKGLFAVAGKVIQYLKTYVRAQLIILFLIGTLCVAVLSAVGVKSSIFYGALTGIMDMLPFIGTGIMLIPLAVIRILHEEYVSAGIILLLYAACALLREFLEPRLIGDKVGIWPAGILFSIFAGMKLFGIFGMIKGPIGLVILCESWKYLFGERGGEISYEATDNESR